MESKPQLSSREKHNLLIYALAVAGVLGLFLALGWIRLGAPMNVPSMHNAEIAVLVPLEGDEAANGKNILDAVIKSKEYFVVRLELTDCNITIRGYDTGNSADSAAWAAFRAARNPNTIAIIGPIDARQVKAVESTVIGKNIPIITPASTTPDINLSSDNGVYRVPAADDLQGPALVDFLVQKQFSNVYLLIEPNSYVEHILNPMKTASAGRIKFVGSADVSQTDPNVDLIQSIKDSKADAIVYLGGSSGLIVLLQGLEEKNVNIPIVGVDSINDPKLAKSLPSGQELFFTSPIYVNNNITGGYGDLLGANVVKPYGFESVEATWLVLKALSAGTDEFGREAVWKNLPNTFIVGIDAQRLELIEGQLSPTYIYVYKGENHEASWFLKPENAFRP
ncbi:MAG: ABC transporter substrate-binding protein [Anaerolineales bacterium]|nr:ABC transporter substrate-binding protein [Anaerolineales bacterium]